MSISESDLQAMECVLDGCATTDEAEHVRTLLLSPAGEAAMQQLRAERGARKSAFVSMEPDDATLERLQWHVSGAMADVRSAERNAARSGWGMSRVGSVAAACVALGFFGGWLGRGQPAAVTSPGFTPVAQRDPGESSTLATNNNSSDVMVPVSNEYGQVVAFQKFHNTADARSFAEELNRANAGDDHVKLLSSEKY